MDLLRLNCEWTDDLTVIPDEDDTECINSSLLILEVEVRPVLYIRSLHQDQNPKDIAKIWNEVATAINADRKHTNNRYIVQI